MRTEHFTSSAPLTYQPGSEALQDFAYEYDLTGNIIAIHERVKGCGVVNSAGGRAALDRRFDYDPLYRLTRATGRERSVIPQPRPWQERTWKDWNSDVTCGFYAPANPSIATQENAPDLTALYWEEYSYDPAGNMTEMRHGGHAGANWTRHFGMGHLAQQDWEQSWPAHLNSSIPWHPPLAINSRTWATISRMRHKRTSSISTAT
jgi:hypothetical protein